MKDKETKEINLLQLINIFFEWIMRILKKAFLFLGFLSQLFFKYWMVSFAIILLSLVVGLYLSRPSARIYKAEAMALFYGCELPTAKEVCGQLQNSLVKEKELSLGAKLGIPDSIANSIVLIENFNVIDYLKDETQDLIDFKKNHSLTDTLNLIMQDRFYLRIKMRNISYVKMVETAILQYFNSNPMIKREYEYAKAYLQSRIDLCDREMMRIDSLAKVSYFKDPNSKINFENDKLIVGEQEKQLFYKDLIQLTDIKSYSQKRLIDYKQPVAFPSGLKVNPLPINNRIKYTISSILIGVSIALLVAFILENLKKIMTYLLARK